MKYLMGLEWPRNACKIILINEIMNVERPLLSLPLPLHEAKRK